MPRKPLDRIDRKLLDLLQQDADRTAEALGTAVGLSASAVQRRIHRLKAEGVIAVTVALVDPARAGAPSFFIVALEVERERSELVARLRRWVSDEPMVQQVYYVTGDADFVMVVAARDLVAYDALMTRLMADNPNVRRFRTSVALGVVKRGVAIPVVIGE